MVLKALLSFSQRCKELKPYSYNSGPWPQEGKGASSSQAMAPSLGLIEVIYATKPTTTPRPTASWVLTVAPVLDSDMGPSLSKKTRWKDKHISFLGKDKDGTTQPHDDALVITL